MSAKTPITNAMRKALAESGKTRYRISMESGVDQAVLSRFMAGKSGLTTATLDALADVLGLRIVADGPMKVPPPAKRGRKAKGTTRKDGEA